MKRNKLILSTGILLIILASFSIIGTLAILDNVSEIVAAIISLEAEVNLMSLIVIYGYYFSILLAQSIVYMIYGVKLVKFSKFNDAYQRCKTMMIVTLILVSCSLLFEPFKYFAGLYIAIIVLNICFLVLNSKNDNISETPAPQTALQETEVEDKVQVIAEKEKSATDIMVEKVMALKKLKDSGVISSSEYDDMIAKSIFSEKENLKEKNKLPETPKRTYKRKVLETEKESKNKSSAEEK